MFCHPPTHPPPCLQTCSRYEFFQNLKPSRQFEFLSRIVSTVHVIGIFSTSSLTVSLSTLSVSPARSIPSILFHTILQNPHSFILFCLSLILFSFLPSRIHAFVDSCCPSIVLCVSVCLSLCLSVSLSLCLSISISISISLIAL
jgi:hypothetical protein